jgi:cobalamin synthase
MRPYDPFAVKLHNLYAGGLAAICLVILQDFFSMNKLDTPSFLAILAFAMALPLLSGTLVMNMIQERFKFGPSKTLIAELVHYTFLAGILLALAGIAAAFWHISAIIGLVFIVSQVFALVVYGLYITRLSESDPVVVAKGAIRTSDGKGA